MSDFAHRASWRKSRLLQDILAVVFGCALVVVVIFFGALV